MGKLLPDISLTMWPLITLVVFVTFFCGLVFWVYRPSAKSKYLNFGSLPLEKNGDNND